MPSRNIEPVRMSDFKRRLAENWHQVDYLRTFDLVMDSGTEAFRLRRRKYGF